MTKHRIAPSKRLRDLIKLAGTENNFAKHADIDSATLNKILKQGLNISSITIAKILKATPLSFDEAFNVTGD